MRKLAVRLEWESRKRAASKAVEYPFACFPAETQAALMSKSVSETLPAVVATPEQTVAVKSDQPEVRSSARLTDAQREVMVARLC
ncbi:DNA-binding protein, partial [Klebsiella pneumoniae]|uniref:DNA-binding protein n=1 Tax=Klebsiella pneumoniae TaxID=573 RepID=UPI0034DF46F8